MRNNRILIIDDNLAIHEDFRKIFSSRPMNESIAGFLNLDVEDQTNHDFQLSFASQGLQGVEVAKQAYENGSPFAVAFVDMRMPPGIDGLETVKAIWAHDPDIQIVICSAFSDHSLQRIQDDLNRSDQFLILKKPFDPMEVTQLAVSLSETWNKSAQEKAIAEQQAQQLKTANQSLTENSLYLEMATQIAGTGYCTVEPDSGAFAASKRTCEILGRSLGELKSWSAFLSSIDDADRNRVNTLFRNATSSNGRSFATKTRFITPGNECRHVQLSFTLQKTEEQKACLFGVLHDISESVDAANTVEFVRSHDVLTRLSNRSNMIEEFEALSIAEQDSGRRFSLIVLDVDSLRAVNESFGQPIGDELLRQLATRLQSFIREDDLLARLDGDRFAIVHCGLNVKEETALLLDEILDGVSPPFEIAGSQKKVTLSAGIAIPDPGPCNLERVIVSAEMALREAKRHGKQQHCYFNNEMEQHARERAAIEAAIPIALQNNQFQIHYQPIISCQTSKTIAIEALARWIHSDLGFIPPDKFIGIAEETGDIVPLGRWVLKQACLDVQKFPADISVSVNVSAVQLEKSDFYKTVLDVLAETELPPARLELEITERVLLGDCAEVVQTLNSLKEMGVKIAMDDFGIGYSSLSYLQQFAFDKLKLDRSFLPLSGPIEESVVIVRAVAGLGNSLRIVTCAEGVETKEQFEMVCREGYNQAQGYLFSRPMPVEQVIEFVAAEARPLLRSDATLVRCEAAQELGVASESWSD